ncbi:MAG: nicotinamide-nucleotide amidohydrolase family protein [Hydrogenothermaceae bacterium]
MKAVIIVTGSEFTEGRKIDRNGNYMAGVLFERGVDVKGIIQAPDNPYDLVNYIKYGLDRSDLVFISGGLGPTTDDYTRQAVADAIGVPLIYDEECLNLLKSYYQDQNLEFTQERKSMCKIPYGSIPIKNPVGRAFGFLKVLDDVRKVIVALPGVPSELKPMFEEVLQKLELTKPVRYVKLLRTFGLKELDINYLLEDMKDLSYSVSPKGVDIFISDRDMYEFNRKVETAKDRLGNFIYAESNIEMEEVVGNLLKEKGLTVSTAESSTGGLIVSRLVNVAGSSSYVMGGIVSYSNEIKINVLGVDRNVIENLGAVSEEVAKQMVIGVRNLLKTDIAVSDTGIAGPTGETPDKPLGLHYIGYFDGKSIKVYKEIYKGERNDVRLYISQFALNVIRLNLINNS